MARLPIGFYTGCAECRDLAIGNAIEELHGIDVYHAKQRENVYRTLIDTLRGIDGGGAGDIGTGEPHDPP